MWHRKAYVDIEKKLLHNLIIQQSYREHSGFTFLVPKLFNSPAERNYWNHLQKREEEITQMKFCSITGTHNSVLLCKLYLK